MTCVAGAPPMFDFCIKLSGDIEGMSTDQSDEEKKLTAELLAEEMKILSESDPKIMFTEVEEHVTSDYDFNPLPFIRFG